MKQEAVGIIIAVLGLVIVKFTGISEACSGEITGWLATIAPVVLGGGVTWLGAVKSGTMTLGGRVK